MVILDRDAMFLDRDYIAGGTPWRLLRLPGGSRPVAERWASGAAVRIGEERFARTFIQQGLLHPLFSGDVSIDDVDVIVPVHDDVASLRRLLEGIHGLHVTIVDDASTATAAIDQCADDFGATALHLDSNRGPGGARNAGARATTRPFLCFIDADVTLDDARDVLRRLRRQFNDPLVGACAPRVRGATGTTWRESFERRFSPLDMGARSGLVIPKGPIGYVPSACLMVRRSAFADGFDEQMRTGEDVDLVWRLHDQGWLVRYLGAVVVSHAARDTWRSWFAQRIDYGASSGELAKRHGDRLAPVRSDPWTLVAWMSVLLGKPMIGARIVRVARDELRTILAPRSDDPDKAASKVIARSMLRAGGPLARAVVRTFGVAVLVGALHPRLRRRLLALFIVGTAWRWRNERIRIRDVPLGIVDDLAYGAGVVKGAWTSRTLATLTPHITKSSLKARDVLGLAKISR
jgi:mycofactocin system glycosyltransferase